MNADNKLYGWACCWAWIFWTSIPGKLLSRYNVDFIFLAVWFSYCLDEALNFLFFLFLCGMGIQAKCLETGETVAIKKVLQDKRYKNRELQTMRLLDHPNVVSLKHCFFSTTEKDELYLNLVLEYVPETIHRVIKHYYKMSQRMPLIYVKLYFYQVWVVYVLSFLLEACLLYTRYRLYDKWFNEWSLLAYGSYLILFFLLMNRFVELLLTFTIVLECAIETSSLKIYWYVGKGAWFFFYLE